MKTKVDLIAALIESDWTVDEIKGALDDDKTTVVEKVVIQPSPYPIPQPIIVERPCPPRRRIMPYYEPYWWSSTGSATVRFNDSVTSRLIGDQ